MNKEQALDYLYSATRKAPLTADVHEACRKAAEVLFQALKPATDAKIVELKPKPEKN